MGKEMNGNIYEKWDEIVQWMGRWWVVEVADADADAARMEAIGW